jgi:hypothetical protein
MLRTADLAARDAPDVADGISALYDGDLDVIVVRQALPAAPVAAAVERLMTAGTHGWSQPNKASTADDIELLGTPATPTFSAPRGPSRDAYLATAGWYGESPVFESGFDPTAATENVLGQLSGGRPVELLRFPDGHTFAPFTVRKLREGQGISLHHDFHYPLALFNELQSDFDKRTLISYFFTLQRPDAGGELVAYPVPPDTPDPPKLPNGWAWDLPEVERRFGSVPYETGPGDLFIFASGRCLHRVAPTQGPRPRITMGGFLALDTAGRRVLYWS